MNTHTPNLAETKRDALRARIEAGERRIAERTFADDAKDAAKAAAAYARANPGKVVVGALALGLVIGLLSSPGRRMAARAASGVAGGIGASAQRGGSKIGMMIANALVVQGLQLLDQVLDEAGSSRREVSNLVSKAVTSAQATGHEAAETSRKLAQRTREQADSAGRKLVQRLKR